MAFPRSSGSDDWTPRFWGLKKDISVLQIEAEQDREHVKELRKNLRDFREQITERIEKEADLIDDHCDDLKRLGDNLDNLEAEVGKIKRPKLDSTVPTVDRDKLSEVIVKFGERVESLKTHYTTKLNESVTYLEALNAELFARIDTLANVNEDLQKRVDNLETEIRQLKSSAK